MLGCLWLVLVAIGKRNRSPMVIMVIYNHNSQKKSREQILIDKPRISIFWKKSQTISHKTSSSLQVLSWKPPVLKVFGRLTGIGSSFLINSNNYTQHCLCPQWCMLCIWVLLPTSWVSLLGLPPWHLFFFFGVHHTRNRNDTKCSIKSPFPFLCCSETN